MATGFTITLRVASVCLGSRNKPVQETKLKTQLLAGNVSARQSFFCCFGPAGSIRMKVTLSGYLCAKSSRSFRRF